MVSDSEIFFQQKIFARKNFWVEKLFSCPLQISVKNFNIISNSKNLYAFQFTEVHKIRHFDCGRDFYVFRNHVFKAYFEPLHVSQKALSHVNKT